MAFRSGMIQPPRFSGLISSFLLLSPSGLCPPASFCSSSPPHSPPSSCIPQPPLHQQQAAPWVWKASAFPSPIVLEAHFSDAVPGQPSQHPQDSEHHGDSIPPTRKAPSREQAGNTCLGNGCMNKKISQWLKTELTLVQTRDPGDRYAPPPPHTPSWAPGS